VQLGGKAGENDDHVSNDGNNDNQDGASGGEAAAHINEKEGGHNGRGDVDGNGLPWTTDDADTAARADADAAGHGKAGSDADGAHESGYARGGMSVRSSVSPAAHTRLLRAQVGSTTLACAHNLLALPVVSNTHLLYVAA
jgi:hypothetical protein